MKKRLILSNNCTASYPSVTPKNWKTCSKESLKKDWRIQFYFKDPLHADKYPNGKQVRIKGMNEFKTLGERREATQILLDGHISKLVDRHYNPITKEFMTKTIPKSNTGLIDTLKYYLNVKQASNSYKT